MLIIARLQNSTFNNAANYNIPAHDWLVLEEGTTLEPLQQINRGLVFLRRFSARLGHSPKVRALLERVQVEFLSRYINEYQIGKNHGGNNIQDSFKVPVGGRFYLSSELKENMLETEKFSADVNVNGIKFAVVCNSYDPKTASSGEHKLTYQVETPITVGQYVLWPVLVTGEELPAPPPPPQSEYDEGDEG
jgi:hypothetical protein